MPVVTKADTTAKAEIEKDANMIRALFSEANALAGELHLTAETLPYVALMLLLIKQNRP